MRLSAFACNPCNYNGGRCSTAYNFNYDGFTASGLGTIGGLYSTNEQFVTFVNSGDAQVYDKIYTTSNGHEALVSWSIQSGGNVFLYDAFWNDSSRSSQDCNTSGFCHIYAGTNTSNGAHIVFQVLYCNSTGCSYGCTPGQVSFSIAGSVLKDNFGYQCFKVDSTPNAASISGGIDALSDQMPGGSANKETLYSANEYSNGAWHSYYNNAVAQQTPNTGAYFGHDSVDNYDGDIYDKQCTQ